MCVASPRLTGKLDRSARSERQVDARCAMDIECIFVFWVWSSVDRNGQHCPQEEFRII